MATTKICVAVYVKKPSCFCIFVSLQKGELNATIENSIEAPDKLLLSWFSFVHFRFHSPNIWSSTSENKKHHCQRCFTLIILMFLHSFFAYLLALFAS